MTMGPAPMMRMDLMSVRFAMGLLLLMLFHEIDKAIEQVAHLVRAGTRFRVALETEGRLVGAGNALQAAIEQRYMGHAHIGWQGRRINRKAVILAGDEYALVVHILHRAVSYTHLRAHETDSYLV